MELTLGSGVWLGQHSHKHGLFKVRLFTRAHTLHVTEHPSHSIVSGIIGLIFRRGKKDEQDSKPKR